MAVLTYVLLTWGWILLALVMVVGGFFISKKKDRNGPVVIGVLGAIAVLLLAWLLRFLLTWRLEVAWWSDLGTGFESSYFTLLKAKIGMFAAGAIVFGCLCYLITRWPARTTKRFLSGSLSGDRNELQSDQGKAFFKKWLGALKAIPVICLLLQWAGIVLAAFVGGIVTCCYTTEALLYTHAVSFGATDPIFSNDVGFYVFRLPLLDALASWCTGGLFVFLLMHVGLAALANAMTTAQVSDRSIPMWFIEAVPDYEHVKKALPDYRGRLLLNAMCAALPFAVAWAVMILLGRYQMLFEERGKALFGVGYMQDNFWISLRWLWAFLPLMIWAFVLSILTGIAGKRSVVGAAVAAVFGVIGITIVGFILRNELANKEFERQTPYVRHNIEATRKAFGLDKIEVKEYEPTFTASLEDLKKSSQTLNNVRLWDWQVLAEVFDQQQSIRSYYDFPDVDVDRYTVDGHLRQVMLASREINVGALENSSSWNNRHLVYTHGYGLTMAFANEVNHEGYPKLKVRDIPPSSEIKGIEVKQPQIYFGELTTEHVYANSGLEEFNYPSGQGVEYSRYQGARGVKLDSWIRRTAAALEFDGLKVVLGGYITPDTKLLWNRRVYDRLNKVAPFLKVDPDIYKVIRGDGSLVYIADLYAVSGWYPYSRSVNGVSYIRNSVKAVVSASDGTVSLYVFDDSDPVIKAWKGIYPTLFKNKAEFPADLLPHIRYPEELMEYQAAVLATYHVEDARVFLSTEDGWHLATEVYHEKEVTVEPFYTVTRLPDAASEEFVAICPFTPKNKRNTIAWLAGRSDGEHYGQLLLYRFPKQKMYRGPAQIESAIDQNENMSRDLTLWKQKGSDVIRGRMLMVPIAGGILYVEPVYLKAVGSGAIPQLTRVAVAWGERVEWDRTFEGALARLFGQQPAAAESTAAPGTQPAPAAVARANEAKRQLAEYYRYMGAGMPEEAATHLKALNAIIEEMAKEEKKATK